MDNAGGSSADPGNSSNVTTQNNASRKRPASRLPLPARAKLPRKAKENKNYFEGPTSSSNGNRTTSRGSRAAVHTSPVSATNNIAPRPHNSNGRRLTVNIVRIDRSNEVDDGSESVGSGSGNERGRGSITITISDDEHIHSPTPVPRRSMTFRTISNPEGSSNNGEESTVGQLYDRGTVSDRLRNLAVSLDPAFNLAYAQPGHDQVNGDGEVVIIGRRRSRPDTPHPIGENGDNLESLNSGTDTRPASEIEPPNSPFVRRVRVSLGNRSLNVDDNEYMLNMPGAGTPAQTTAMGTEARSRIYERALAASAVLGRPHNPAHFFPATPTPTRADTHPDTPLPGSGRPNANPRPPAALLFMQAVLDDAPITYLMDIMERLGDMGVPIGVSQTILDNLPTLEFGSVESKNQGSCVICMCEYEIGNRLRHLPCQHNFHMQCIDTWLRQRGSCPICRNDVRVAANASGY